MPVADEALDGELGRAALGEPEALLGLAPGERHAAVGDRLEDLALERELGRHPDTQLVYAHRAGRRLIGWLDVADAANLGVVC